MCFKNWMENQEKIKELILLRGISGSGKSTIAKKYVGNGVVFSTDDFFMMDGKYFFDPKKLGLNHKKNQERTEIAMRQGISPVIIDNTNFETWEMKIYVDLADKFGYSIKILETEPIELEELIKRQENRRSINKTIPRETLEKMLKKYKRGITVDDVRRSTRPF